MSNELEEELIENIVEPSEEPLPSLYDYLLTQEKLAAEIRKQNKELRLLTKELSALKEHSQQLEDQLAGMSFSKENPIIEESSCHDFLMMEALDVLLTLKEAAESSTAAVLQALPKSRSFWRRSTPEWRIRGESILKGYCLGVSSVHDKFLAFLKDMRIEVIIPEIEGPFSPLYHRALEQVQGGKSGVIAKVIRYGYLREGKVLRYADVSVFK